MTKRALLIAEKISLMHAIQDAVKKHGFPDDITYKTFVGHTMTLKLPGEYREDWEQMKTTIKDLPMIPEPFEYKVSNDKQKLFKDIKKEVESGNYDYVINACDIGREGQHIFWSFFETIGSPLPVKRLWSKDTSLDSLGEAINNLRDESEPRLVNITNASKLRAQFDWLIGMNGSRAFSEKTRSGLPVGRVMTPTLNLVVERELEIRNFKSKTFYEVQASFDDYTGKYTEKETRGRFSSKKEADDFIKGLSNKATVKTVEKSKQTTRAPELFSLQSLQSEAGKRYGYTMSETLEIAQQLYDDGFLSYPRTDSPYVTENTARTFPVLLETVTKWDPLKKQAKAISMDNGLIGKISTDKRYVDDSKVEDHDALLPTKQAPTRILSKDEQNIYDMVSRRFIAIFMSPLIVEKTKVVTSIDKHDFITNGSVLVQRGFTELYGYSPKDQELPKLTKNDTKNVKKLELLTGKTTPPKRYTSSSLGDAMAAAGRFADDKSMKEILKESSGIGTVATRGNIVEKLISRDWMKYKGKAKTIHATDSGISIIQTLDGHEITSVELTAEWEQKLRNVEKGLLTTKDFERDMENYIEVTIRDIERKTFKPVVSAKAKSGVGSIIGTCPTCGGDVVMGKKVYFCKNYDPESKGTSCDFIMGRKVAGANLSKTEMKKMLDGKKTKLLKMHSNKTGNDYEARLYWNKSEKKLELEFPKKTTSSTGKKTKSKTSDGKAITEDRFYWKVNSAKIGKEIWGVKISEKEAQELFNGKKLGPFTFTWSSGKSSNAKISFDNKKNKVVYDFN